MKLQICAEIEGQFLLKDKVEAKLYPYHFEILKKDDRYFIRITKTVANYMDYVPKSYVKDGSVHMEATKSEIYRDLKEWLYYIEAMGAFNFEVAKIHIDELEVKWIYETKAEKGLIPIISLKRQEAKTLLSRRSRSLLAPYCASAVRTCSDTGRYSLYTGSNFGTAQNLHLLTHPRVIYA